MPRPLFNIHGDSTQNEYVNKAHGHIPQTITQHATTEDGVKQYVQTMPRTLFQGLGYGTENEDEDANDTEEQISQQLTRHDRVTNQCSTYTTKGQSLRDIGNQMGMETGNSQSRASFQSNSSRIKPHNSSNNEDKTKLQRRKHFARHLSCHSVLTNNGKSHQPDGFDGAERKLFANDNKIMIQSASEVTNKMMRRTIAKEKKAHMSYNTTKHHYKLNQNRSQNFQQHATRSTDPRVSHNLTNETKTTNVIKPTCNQSAKTSVYTHSQKSCESEKEREKVNNPTTQSCDVQFKLKANIQEFGGINSK